MLNGFSRRSRTPEIIDTGAYTSDEYEQFLVEIRRVNRMAGDRRALSKSLLSKVRELGLKEFSVLDVGAGSGELLRACAEFARSRGAQARLVGLELNERSSQAIVEESTEFDEVLSVRGDALKLPFRGQSFDFALCSLFTHHFSDRDIVTILNEMARIASRAVYVIDLHRHRGAYVLYKAFSHMFLSGRLVRSDGALSIKRGFLPSELLNIAKDSRVSEPRVRRRFPYRLVLEAGPRGAESTDV